MLAKINVKNKLIDTMKIFKTRQQLADELGISRATLSRKLKKSKIEIPKGLLAPKDQNKILALFGVEKDEKNFVETK